jgi:AraC-like DNA-binding protein
VEHYWLVKWDLRGQPPYNSETLPHPSIHLAIEPEVAHIVGVVTTKFSRILQGQGWAFGIKFKPGGFYPFVQRPISQYTDKTINLAGVFGEAGTRFESAMRAATGDEEMVAVAEEFLRQQSPAHDEHIVLIKQIIESISTERAMTKVDDLVRGFKINKRSLQRLFSQYVGVSPKWVIQRYRLHEATEQMALGEIVDWSRLAVDLGYFDQAHFIKDFKAIVGLTPAEYAKELAEHAPIQRGRVSFDGQR